MVYTLTGANTFLLRAALDERVKRFVAEHGDFGLERIDGEEAAYDRMRESLESMPFLASKKLVVLRAPSANKQFVEHAEKLLSSVTEDTDVLIVEPKLDKRLSYYKYLKKHTEYQEYNELDEMGLSKWLAAQAKEQGGALSTADARYIIDRIGVGQQRLSNELAKLLAYNPSITRESIELLVEMTPQSTIFELLDAAFAGKPARALALYDEQRKSGVEAQQITAMLGWQLHIVAVVKMAGDRDPTLIAKEAKLNPFVVRKTSAVTRSLSVLALKKLVSAALNLDIRLKSSAIDADEAARLFILQLAEK
jgi:DNA polymerase III delta subunit